MNPTGGETSQWKERKVRISFFTFKLLYKR
jgi:hypothetical protein